MTARALAALAVGAWAAVAAAQDAPWIEPWVREDRKWFVPPDPPAGHAERVRARDVDAQAWLDGLPTDRRGAMQSALRDAARGDANTRATLAAQWTGADIPFAAIELLARGMRVAPGGTPGLAELPFALPDGSTSTVHVDLPADYRPDGGPYPLLLTLHGSGEPPEPRRDRFARLLHERGWIVAAPLSTPNQGRGWGSTALERAVPLACLDALLRAYAVDPDRVVLNGYSMGANGTWEVAMLHRDRFAGIAADAGGPRFRCFPFLGNLAELPIRANVGGDEDPLLRQAVAEAVAFLGGKLGGPVVHTVTPGIGHDEPAAWLDAMAEWLPTVRRDCYPRALCQLFASLEQGRCHWVQALAIGPKVLDATTGRIPVKADPDENRVRANYVAAGRAGSARIAARVDGQTIAIETRHVPKLAVFLSDRLCDLEQKITVTVNGTTAWSGVPKRSVRQLLDEIAASGDADRVYAVRLELRGR